MPQTYSAPPIFIASDRKNMSGVAFSTAFLVLSLAEQAGLPLAFIETGPGSAAIAAFGADSPAQWERLRQTLSNLDVDPLARCERQDIAKLMLDPKAKIASNRSFDLIAQALSCAAELDGAVPRGAAKPSMGL